MIGAQSEFAARFQEFIFYAGPIVQIVYWLVLAAASVYAVALLKRWVDLQTRVAAPADDLNAPGSRGPVSTDQFVE